MSFKLDKTDLKILDILQRQAKITNAQLSKDIKLSPAPTLERVKKLENLGYIKSYHAKLDTQRLGLGVTTFVSIKLAKHNKASTEQFIAKVLEIDEVIECHYITGSSDYLLKVVARDIQAYQNIMLNKISEIEEIDNMQTMVVLSTPKDSQVIPIPEEVAK